MTGEQATSPTRRADYDRHLATAADALVAAIRTGVTDGGETITHLVARAAANLGGMYKLTKARRGSWEAHHVDQMLTSTVGYDGECLLAYRTAPIEVVECVDLVMLDAGLLDIYEDSALLIDAVESAAYDAGDETAGARAREAARLLDQLRDADYAAYRREFERQVRAAAEALVRTWHLPPGTPVTVRWAPWERREQATRAQEDWMTVEYQLFEAAHNATGLPGVDVPINWAHNPVEQLRAAGRLPHQRIPQLAHYTSAPHENEQDTTS